MISPAIRATLNAAGIVRNMAHAVVYGPAMYQGFGVLNPFFLQQIIHIITLITEAVCNSSTGKLLRYSAETFRVEIGIPLSLTSTLYDEKTFASYCPLCWYKSLWRFMSKAIYKLDLREEYPDLQPLRVNDVFLMQLFVDSGFRGADLESLNFTRKNLEAITLADIATVDGVESLSKPSKLLLAMVFGVQQPFPMLYQDSRQLLSFCGRKLSPSPSSTSTLVRTVTYATGLILIYTPDVNGGDLH